MKRNFGHCCIIDIVAGGNKTGQVLFASIIMILFVLSALMVTLGSVKNSTKVFNAKISKQKAYANAMKGIHYGYVELLNTNLDFITHVLNGNNLAKSSDTPTPTIKSGSIDENGDYKPTGSSDILVRTYRDATGHYWVVSKGIGAHNGVESQMVAKVQVDIDSLYDFFFFFTKSHTFGDDFIDGGGFGRIYVNGNIMFADRWNGTPARFVNIAELSTNADGGIYFTTWSKYPPYIIDTANGGVIDGYALLGTRRWGGGEFGFTDGSYPSDVITERCAGHSCYGGGWGPEVIHRNSKNVTYRSPEFKFTKDVMDKYGINIGLTADEQTVRLPRLVTDEAGTPINHEWDLYSGKDAKDVPDEQPVKYVRFYYQKDGQWKFTADPEKAEYAQIFNMEDDTGTNISYKYKKDGVVVTREIPVLEDGTIQYKWVDKDGVEHIETFNKEYEEDYWKKLVNPSSNSYNNGYKWREDYIKNGYTRYDGAYPGAESDFFHNFDTRYPQQAERFKDWLEGKYRSSPESNETYRNMENSDLNLLGIIKDKHTGAKTYNFIELERNLAGMARENGLWIGYEKEDGVEDLRVYLGGELVFSEQRGDEMPSWLKKEEFITGVKRDHTNKQPITMKAQTLTLDVKTLGEEYNLDSKMNGVVYVNYRKPSETTRALNKGLKIVNAETIPRKKGMTFVSPLATFVQGDLNYQQMAPEDEREWAPTSIIADSQIYLLSKDFTPPAETPAYSQPICPNPNSINGGWIDYLASKLGSDFWPSYSDPEDVRRQKLLAMEDEVRNWYAQQPDKAYGAPDNLDFINDIDPNVMATIKYAAQGDFFEKYHPNGDGDIKAYPMVKDDEDNRKMYIYASLVTYPNDGADVTTLENFTFYKYKYTTPAFNPWENRRSDGSINDYTVEPEIIIKGMRPDVDGEYSGGHWSNDYTSYAFIDTSDRFYNYGIHSLPVYPYRVSPLPKSFAQNYSDSAPPGDLNLLSKGIFLFSEKDELFNKHRDH